MKILDEIKRLVDKKDFKQIEDYQRLYERKQQMWGDLFRSSVGKAILEHIEEEIQRLHIKLENSDDIDARAELKIYRKILAMKTVSDNNISVK